jgi:hypothetical protein
MTDSPQPATPSKTRERLKWLASILLALMIVCCGCGFFITTGLVARGELTTSALGTDFRLWTITNPQQAGVGFQRSFGVQRDGRSCTHFDVTFILWKPNLSIDNTAYDNCE